jgi:hypothetical protein
MPPEREKPPKFPVPTLPPDVILPGCSELEADLEALRTDLWNARSAMKIASEVLKDLFSRLGKLPCSESILDQKQPDTTDPCWQYYNGKRDYDRLKAEFDAKYAEFLKKAQQFNSKFPSCNTPLCPGNQPQKGTLNGFSFPKITLPSVAGYMAALQSCKDALGDPTEGRIRKANEKKQKKEKCLEFAKNAASVFSNKILGYRKVYDFDTVFNNGTTKEVIIEVEGPEPQNATTALNALGNFVKALDAKLRACDTDKGYIAKNVIPIPPPEKTDEKYLAKIKKWFKEDVSQLITKFADALSQEIKELEEIIDCMEKVENKLGEIIGAVTEEALGKYENTINKKIRELCEQFVKIEISGCSIIVAVANQPTTGSDSVSISVTDEGELASLLFIDRDSDPPVGKISLGAARDLVVKRLGEQNTCPPSSENDGKWTLPMTVTLTVKQSNKDTKGFQDAIGALRYPLGRKVDCTKECPEIIDVNNGDFVPINVNIPEVTAVLTDCEGAPAE